MPQTPKPKTDPYADIAEDPYAGIAEGATPPPVAVSAAPPGPAVAPFDEQAWYQSQSAPVRAISAFESGYGIPRSVQRGGGNEPWYAGLQEAGQGIKLAALHPGLELESLRQMWDSMSQAQQDLLGRSAAAYGQPGVGNKFYGFALGVYSMIPVMGPAIVDALESFQKGDKAGGVGKIAAIVSQTARPGESPEAAARRVGPYATEPVGGQPGMRGTLAPPPQAAGQRALTAARRFTGVRPEVKEAVTKAAEERPGQLAKSRVEREATIRQNIEKEHAARTKFDRQKLEAAQENQAKEARNQAQQQQVLRHQALEGEVDTESQSLGKDLENLEHDVWQEANRRMDAVKPQGNPTGDSAPLIANVKDIQKNVLQDIPENVKEFNRVLGMENTSTDLVNLRNQVAQQMGFPNYDSIPTDPPPKSAPGSLSPRARADEAVQALGPQINASEPLTWEKLQSLKSRLDARLRNTRGMNPDLKRGLFQARDAVVDEMGNLLHKSGANVADWDAARKFYREFKEDFHEPRGPSQSGSPVARALDAVDPAQIRKPFAGDVQSALGNRGVNTLRKYAQWGGNAVADRVEGILAKQQEQNLLPDKYRPEKPTPVPETLQLPTREAAAPIPERPVVDIDQESRRAIAKRAKSWGQFNARDIGILSSSIVGGMIGHMLNLTGVTHGASSLLPVAALTYEMGKYFASGALDKPRVVDWLARTPQAELNALARIPGVDGVNVRNGLTEVALEAGRQGKISISQQLRTFLGPRNVQRLISAGAIAGAATTQRQRSPGQQIRDLRKIQEKFSDNPHMPIGPGQ